MAQPVTITPPSANIEPGESVTLTASGATYYVWSPAEGLLTTDGPMTVASPLVTTTYTCEGYVPGAESVVNGDFASGNTDFTSAYEYNSNLGNEGTYYVDADASLHHDNYHGFGHGDNGNFMMVNGANEPGTNVWTQEITVLPNKWYAFSTWVCTLGGSSWQVARLQFSINNVQIGGVFSAPSQTMVWQQFYELWYSGNSTTATITILNQNTNGNGNDFGLDDISFRELALVGNQQCTIFVSDYQMPPIEYHYVCYAHDEEPSWTWDKNGVTYHADTIDEVILPNPTGGYDILYRLDLKFHEEFYQVNNVVSCDVYTWPINGQTYLSNTTVMQTFTSSFGNTQCDSTYVLVLEISPYEVNSFSIDTCDFYYWDPKGKPFTSYSNDPSDHIYRTSGIYTRTYLNQSGCDSIVTLRLSLDYTPNPTAIYPVDENNQTPHWVVVATDSQINSYEFNIWEQTHNTCHWDSVSWQFVREVDDHWEADTTIQWLLQPDTTTLGMLCRMYVLNYVEDTVWLEATAFNKCAPEGVSRRHWFVCSFNGMEEQELNPADFSVVPNPNNGQMTLHFDHFSGDINIKVYDMRGALIDQFETYAGIESNSYIYRMRQQNAGIYFIVASSQKGTRAKKVVIQH